MSVDFVLEAKTREDLGKGASRRLRRAGQIPAIIYGGAKNRKPTSITLEHKDLMKQLENEAFYSHVLTLKVEDKEEQVVLMDLQRHPARVEVLHADFQRVTKSSVLHKKVPLHFINEDTCVGVKMEGGSIQHNATEVEITCKAADLPEFIEIDLLEVHAGSVVHLSDIKAPKGVNLVALSHGDDQAIATVSKPKGEVEEDEETSEEE